MNLSGSSGLDLRSSLRELEHDAEAGARTPRGRERLRLAGLPLRRRPRDRRAGSGGRSGRSSTGGGRQASSSSSAGIRSPRSGSQVTFRCRPPSPSASGSTRRSRRQDAADSEASGYAEWEVRIDLPSRHEAVELATTARERGAARSRAAGASSSSAPRQRRGRGARQAHQARGARRRPRPGAAGRRDGLGHDRSRLVRLAPRHG